jgi:hypothetical protein
MILVLFIALNLFFTDIKGKIIDETGQPIAYALIRAGEVYAVSNDSGEFLLKDVSNVSSVEVSCLGYKSSIFIINSYTDFLEISLASQVFELDEITVTPADPKEIMRLVIDQIFKDNLYTRRPMLYEYGQSITAKTETNSFFRKDYYLIERKNNGSRRLPEFKFLFAYADTTNWDSLYFQEYYQSNYFLESMQFFNELSHNPGFLDPDRFLKYNFEITDDTSEVYQIAITSKGAKQKYNGLVLVSKDDHSVRYLRYVENDRFLKSENLKLSILTKPTKIKKIDLKGKVYEFWTEKEEDGTYFVKLVKVSILMNQELKNGNGTNFLIETKLNAKQIIELQAGGGKYYSPNEISLNGPIFENILNLKKYQFNLLFD